jgi:hypothetical protein
MRISCEAKRSMNESHSAVDTIESARICAPGTTP